MTRYDSTRQAWEDIWQQATIEAELDAVASERSRETMAFYLPYLPKDEPILEAGSGMSAVVMSLRAQGYHVLGLDYALAALRSSKHYDNALPLSAGDVHALPFADQTIGAYLSFGVLEHFEHGMLPALQEACRILRKNGVLVLTIPYPNVVQQLVTFKRRLSGQSLLNDDAFYESTYSRDALIHTVEAAGFRVLLAEPTSHAYTLWGLGGPFRASGYYETTSLADGLARVLRQVTPWAFNHMTLIVARRR